MDEIGKQVSDSIIFVYFIFLLVNSLHLFRVGKRFVNSCYLQLVYYITMGFGNAILNLFYN